MIHDNNTLFISIYNKNNAALCPGFCHQILNQKIKSSLLNIFIECSNSHQTYSQYFNLENTNKSKLFFQHSDTQEITFKDALSNYVNQYNYFIVINESHLLCSDFLNEIQANNHSDENSIKIYSTNDKKSIPALFFPKKSLVNLLRHELTLSSLNFINIKDEIVVDNFYSLSTKTTETIKPIVYENQYCLFCEVKENKNISELSDSYIYINKRNNKVYNINNNIFGEVIRKTETFTEISWVIGENKQKSIYDIVIHE